MRRARFASWFILLSAAAAAQQYVISTYAGGAPPLLYAGGSPGSVAGLLQMNVRVPANAGAGERAPFVLIIGSHWTVYQVTIALR